MLTKKEELEYWKNRFYRWNEVKRFTKGIDQINNAKREQHARKALKVYLEIRKGE